MIFKNKTYDILKFIAQYLLPGLATCVATIFKIWNIPYGVEISATIMAIDTLLGVMLGISSAKYNESIEETIADTQEK